MIEICGDRKDIRTPPRNRVLYGIIRGAMRKISVFTIGLLLCATGASLGYRDDYPPYRFKDNPPSHLNVRPLVSGEGDYESKDRSVVVHLKEPKSFEVEFFIKVGKTTLVSSYKNMEWFPCKIFQADLNNDSRDDFIVFYNSRGPGLGGCQDKVEIYLRKNNGEFEKISYDTFDAGIEDFIGPDKEGRYKTIITGFYEGNRHNYFTYNVYEFRNYRLINADTKVKEFQKFIQYTNKPNDKDTGRLTKQERFLHTKEKDNSIHYEEIK